MWKNENGKVSAYTGTGTVQGALIISEQENPKSGDAVIGLASISGTFTTGGNGSKTLTAADFPE